MMASKINQELRQVAREKVKAINRKAVLYRIMEQTSKGENGEPRFDFTPEFISFIVSTGVILNRHPNLLELYEGDGSEDADYVGVLSIISRYLALNRILDRKEAGLKEWEKRSSLIETSQQEISNEETLLQKAYANQQHNDNQHLDELSDLTDFVYKMLRYIQGVGRLIPLFREMGRRFER